MSLLLVQDLVAIGLATGAVLAAFAGLRITRRP
jgi:hypothetical protein